MLRPLPLSSTARLTGILMLAAVGALAGCHDTAAPTQLPRIRPIGRPGLSSVEAGIAGIAEGQVIVRFRAGADHSAVEQDHDAQHATSLLLDRTELLTVEVGKEESAAAELAQDPRVEFAQPNFATILAPCAVGNCLPANDFLMGYRWDLNNTGFIVNGAGTTLAATGRVDADIDWLEMFDALGAAPQGTATIGIIDTGIRGTHEELAGRVTQARNFAFGYATDPNFGPDFTIDRIGHGTHVAGIAAARGNNGVGAAGIAYGPNIRLLNAKACELYLSGTTVVNACFSSSVSNAIVWAVDNGANVLNLSLGTPGNSTAGDPTEQLALQYARAHNVLPFCAAGNENFPDVGFPARFPECVAVGATNWSDQRASYSNFGSKVELSAPGGDASAAQPYSFILSSWSDAPPCTTGSNNCYVWTAGTSMAAPQVAGLAAVLFASGITDANAVLARLDETADDLGAPGRDPEFGFGRINAYRALTRTDPGAPPIAHIDPVAAGVEGSPLSFSSSGSLDPNNHPITYRWDFGDGSSSTDANPAHTYVDNGVYHVMLTVTDESNRSASATTDVTIANLPPVVTASLTSSSILSGQSVSLHGTFSDAGVVDAPWQWAIAWGEGTSAGSVTSQSVPIDVTKQYCAAGAYRVRLSVTDKDGGVGSAEQPISVARNAVRIAPPRDFEDFLEGRGRLPVVIYGTPTFDARTVDPATATLGDGEGDETPVARRRDRSFFTTIEDDNRDGRPDLILYFERNVIADLLNAPSNHGIRRPLPASITVVLRATLTDACTQVEGSWTFRFKRW